MMLLTPELRAALRANEAAHIAAQREGRRSPDPLPVVKFFNPMGAATWLATELDEDGDTLFGLADLGFDCPELGYFSLSEIESVRLPGGLGIERDLYFEPRFPLSAYAEVAKIAGRITEAEALLSTVARARHLFTPRDSEIPPTPDG
jgi:hypothetical protein